MNYWDESYYEKNGEEFIFKIINKIYLNQEIIIFDVSENIGGYTKSIIKNIVPNFTLHSFEPTSYCNEELKKINQSKLIIHQIRLTSNDRATTINFNYEGFIWT